MALKNILVHVTDTDQAELRIAAALDLAMRHDAHLTGLGVEPNVDLPTYVAPEIPEPILEEIREQHRARAAKAHDRFEAAMKKAGWADRSDWMTEHGDPVDVVALHSRYADLTVVGQATPPETADGEAGLGSDLVLRAGRPILVIPFTGTQRPIGERVVVAWNGSREAARAVGDAMPILEKAAQVDVLSIQPEGLGDEPGADITHHLARHGIKATTKRSVANMIDAGDVLLNFVSDTGADLIVMGAYGHSRMREIVLGGVTREVLGHMTVPALLSH